MRLAAVDVSVDLGGRRVLTEASACIEPGRITGIIGPNGAGKSTLLRALAGLQRPSKGAVTLDGRPITELDVMQMARAIAFLPQERVVHWPLSVRAVAALGRIPHRHGPAGDGAADAAAIDAALAATDVAHLAERSIATISGGEMARVLFARALTQQARILLADEPTAGLDPAHALELFAILERLAASGRAIAIVLHDLSLAARFCHDVVIVQAGRVVMAGPRAAIMTAARLGPVFGVHMAVGVFDGLPIVVPVGTRAQ